MKELMKKVLTDKRMRNITALSVFALTVVTARGIWNDVV